jgi:hypothetical protein
MDDPSRGDDKSPRLHTRLTVSSTTDDYLGAPVLEIAGCDGAGRRS